MAFRTASLALHLLLGRIAQRVPAAAAAAEAPPPGRPARQRAAQIACREI